MVLLTIEIVRKLIQIKVWVTLKCKDRIQAIKRQLQNDDDDWHKNRE